MIGRWRKKHVISDLGIGPYPMDMFLQYVVYRWVEQRFEEGEETSVVEQHSSHSSHCGGSSRDLAG